LKPSDLDRFYRKLSISGGSTGDGLAPGTVRRTHGIVHRALEQGATTREAPMSAYVPIDLHRHRSVVMHTAADGEVVGWVRLANDPEELVAEVLKAGEAPEVAIEATYGWYWAVDALEAAGANVHLVAPSVSGVETRSCCSRPRREPPRPVRPCACRHDPTLGRLSAHRPRPPELAPETNTPDLGIEIDF
jgi:hypothetical protein